MSNDPDSWRKGEERGGKVSEEEGDGEGGEGGWKGRGSRGGEGIERREGDRGEERGGVEIIKASHLASICACVIMCIGNELQFKFF